ncbi:MAG: NADH-quinone oxidoreductase subunit M [Nitrospinota bacterium]|nr:NADH-quinone oxidoreductase subunit M [Nitrospinota bacterium]
MNYILTGIIFVPIIAGIVVMLTKVVRNNNEKVIRISNVASVVTFVLSLVLLVAFDSHHHGMQFVQSFEWIPLLHINYTVGVDGISLWLVVLTAFLGVLAIYFAPIQKKYMQYFLGLILILEGGTLGVFAAMDSILFYVFWELMLIPAYFIIGFWGEGNKVYATTKFVIYTLVGSLLMLVGIIWVTMVHYEMTHVVTFDIPTLLQTQMPGDVQFYMFVLFFMAFAVKIPIFPFHSWLPHAYISCPIPALILITGAMSKAGAYGLIRFCLPLFPETIANWGLWIGSAAAGGIVYGAWIAVTQRDLKALVAYSSISHLGFIALGIFAFNGQGVEGSVLQMVNHGIIASALFIIVGILEKRLRTRNLDQIRGLKQPMPVLYAMFMLITLAALGLPGLNGFVGEFLILMGVWGSHLLEGMGGLFVLAAGLAIVYASIYMLFMFQGVMQESVEKKFDDVKDLDRKEMGLLIPACILVVIIGLYPKGVIDRVSPAVDHVIHMEKKVKPFGGDSGHGGGH